MTRRLSVFAMAMFAALPTVHAQQAAPPPSASSPLAALASERGSPTGSPAERRIASARQLLAGGPKRADGWNELALALSRRARETADPTYYREAWAATERSLQLEPGNLEGRKQAWILLGQHEFARAVEAAEQLNRAVPDDVLIMDFSSTHTWSPDVTLTPRRRPSGCSTYGQGTSPV